MPFDERSGLSPPASRTWQNVKVSEFLPTTSIIQLQIMMRWQFQTFVLLKNFPFVFSKIPQFILFVCLPLQQPLIQHYLSSLLTTYLGYIMDGPAWMQQKGAGYKQFPPSCIPLACLFQTNVLLFYGNRPAPQSTIVHFTLILLITWPSSHFFVSMS